MKNKDDYLINPSVDDIKDYCLNTDYGYLRGFYIIDEKMYIFGDGYYMTHDSFDKKIGKDTIHLFSVVENDEVKIYPINIVDLYNVKCVKNAVYYLKNLDGILCDKCKKDYFDKIIDNKKDILFYKEVLFELNNNELLKEFVEYKKKVENGSRL